MARPQALQGPMQAAIAKATTPILQQTEAVEALFVPPKPSVVLDSPEDSIQTLLEQSEALAAKITAMRRERRTEALHRARRLIEAYELRQDELYQVLTPVQLTKGKRPPRFRDPHTGQVWSGFGRAPRWYNIAEDKQALLIRQ